MAKKDEVKKEEPKKEEKPVEQVFKVNIRPQVKER